MEPYPNTSEYSFSYYYDEFNGTIDYTLFELLCTKEEVRTFIKSFLPVFYSIVFLVGLAGNSLVVAIYAYFKKLKTKTDAYIMNLAIADLLLLSTLPFWAANAAKGWILGIPLCKITFGIYTMTFSASMVFLACISVDRYHAIVKSQRQQRPVRHCSYTCSFVWATAMLLSIPDLIFSTVKEHHNRIACLQTFPESLGKIIKVIIEILEITLSFVLPLLIMLICYSAVARALFKSSSVKKCKSLKVLAMVVAAFIITQLPYNVIKLWRALEIIHPLITNCSVSKAVDVALQVTNSIALFHCCLNPILYFFMGASFKTHMVKIMKRCASWRRQQSMVPEEICMDPEDSTGQTSSFTI